MSLLQKNDNYNFSRIYADTPYSLLYQSAYTPGICSKPSNTSLPLADPDSSI